jgi:hypothetical protein
MRKRVSFLYGTNSEAGYSRGYKMGAGAGTVVFRTFRHWPRRSQLWAAHQNFEAHNPATDFGSQSIRTADFTLRAVPVEYVKVTQTVLQYALRIRETTVLKQLQQAKICKLINSETKALKQL